MFRKKKLSMDELRNDEVVLAAEDGTEYTNRMIDDLEQKFAAGDFGEGEWGPIQLGPGSPGGPSKREWRRIMSAPPGRPRLAPEPTDVVTFKMPRSLVDYIKKAAKANGQSKSQFIREAVLEKAQAILDNQ